jgi:hypothetical protein
MKIAIFRYTIFSVMPTYGNFFFAPKGDWRAIAGGWISRLLVPWSKHVETVGFYLAKLVYKCGTV